MFVIVNKSQNDMSQAEEVFNKFFPYAQNRLGYDKPIKVNLISDPENAKDPFGKTAYYDPKNMEITLFIDGRHVKDILRSLSHELVHHTQNCRGEFDQKTHVEPGYAQNDPHMRKMEAEAYLLGNGFLVRDFEDLFIKGDNKMNENALRKTVRGALEALYEKKEKKPDKDGDGVPDWAEKEDKNENLDEAHEHPGETCEEAHKGIEHEEYAQLKAVMNTPHRPIAENMNKVKNYLLVDRLVKRWTK